MRKPYFSAVPPVIGTTFGHWVVIEDVIYRNSEMKIRWKCRCVCGRERLVLVDHLRQGRSSGCGCKSGTKNRKRPYEALYNTLLKNKRGLPVTITYDQFVTFTAITACFYCCAEVSWSAHYIIKNGSGYNLDRKDNTLGYTMENVVVACGRCNRARWDIFTYEQFIEVGKLFQKWEGRNIATESKAA